MSHSGDGGYGKSPSFITSGVIYVCSDDLGAAIYIGQTIDWRERKRAHMRTEWWDLVRSVDLIPAFGLNERLAEETRKIVEARPRFNYKGCGSQGPRVRSGREQAEILRMNRRREAAGEGAVETYPPELALSRVEASGDPSDEWWDLYDVAAHLRVHKITAMTYEGGGILPGHDRWVLGQGQWRPSTILDRFPISGQPVGRWMLIPCAAGD